MVQIKDAHVFDQWPLTPRTKEDADALEFLRTYFEGYAETSLAEPASEYMELFIGPANAIPLWESVWITKDRLLFDGPMFDVREQYARYGLVAPNSEHEPDDHIGLEVSFLGGILGCMADTIENNDNKSAREHGAAALNFLNAHLALWAPQFLHAVADRAEAPFYGAVALLCDATLNHAGKLLQDTQA